MYRTINKYCLPMLANCTPHIDSDFDASVKEFCAHKRGLSSLSMAPPDRDQSKKTAPNDDILYQQQKQEVAANKLQARLADFEPSSKLINKINNSNQHLQTQQKKSSHHSDYVQVSDNNDPSVGLNHQLQNKSSQCNNQQAAPKQHHYTNLHNVPQSCKVIVTGDVAVGKTSLINRFGYDVYSSHYKTTIGVDFDVQKFQILGLPFVLQIWDTAGLERFKCITSSYYRGCQVAIIVFDMSNLETLKNAIKWRDEILESCQTYDQLVMGTTPPISPTDGKQATLNDNHTQSLTEKHNNYLRHQQQALIHYNSLPIVFLVGSKSDLISDVDLEFVSHQAKIIANRMQAELWTVSAQTGDNVNELFTRVATISFNKAVLKEILLAKYEASTLGVCLKQKILQQQQQQKALWNQGKLIKITRKKKGDDKRAKCINIQCIIK